VAVVWTEPEGGGSAVFLAVSQDGGASLAPGVRVTDADGNLAQAATPAVAFGPTGQIYVVWRDNRDVTSTIYFAESENGGATIKPNRPVEGPPRAHDAQTDPVVGVAPDGNIYVAWAEGGTAIRVARSEDGGASFKPSEQQSDAADGTRGHPTIAVNGTGVYLAWADTRNGNPDIYATASSDGISFKKPDVRVDGDQESFSQTGPSVAVDEAGTAYVAWTDTRAGMEDIYLAKTVETGFAFDAGIPVQGAGGAPGTQFQASLVVSPGGTVYVGWTDGSEARTRIRMASSTDQGATFSAPETVTVDPGVGAQTLPGLVVVRVEGTDRLHAAFLDTRYGTSDVFLGTAPAPAIPALTATLTTDPVTGQVVGSPVTLTAGGSGGLPPYTFQWEVDDGSGFMVVQEWGAADQYVWNPLVVGTYRLRVLLRNADSVSAGNATAEIASYAVVPPSHTLTVSKVGSGTVTSVPPGIDCGPTCSAEYFENADVTLTATPAPSYEFAGWSGPGAGECAAVNPCVITMTAAKSVTATFTPLGNLLTVVKAGTGSGTVIGTGIACGEDCTEAYSGTPNVALAATADVGSTFSGWSGACTGTGTCSVLMNVANKTVTATFMLKSYVLTVTKTGTGAGSVSSDPSGIDTCAGGTAANCNESFAHGDAVTLTATPSATSNFAGWSGIGAGACAGTTGPCVVAMTAAKSVTATFTLKTYPLTVTNPGGGNVTASPVGISCRGPAADCSHEYDHGKLVTLTATPLAGFTFGGWTGACTNTTGSCPVTMTDAKSVTASFKTALTVTVARTGSGTGQVTSDPGILCSGTGSDCSESYPFGTTVDLTAAPTAGSAFTGWSVGCTGIDPACAVTVTAANPKVTATFGPVPYALTVTLAGPANSGSVSSNPTGIACGSDCTEAYLNGTGVTLTAAPTAGHAFVGWSGAGCSGAGSCVVSMDAAKAVTATFDVTHALTVGKADSGGGLVTSSPAGVTCGADCSEPYANGSVVTLTAAPDGSSTFTGWSGGGCSGTGACTVTMSAATEVTASFARATFTLTAAVAGSGTGTIVSSPLGVSCGADCSESYVGGTPVTLTATADPSSSFTGWTGACSGTAACAVTMDGAKSVTATFTLVPFTLTVARAGTGGGTVNSAPAGIDCGADCAESYGRTMAVTLTAAPDATSSFAGWAGGCTGTGACVVTMSAAKSVTATFTRTTFPLTVIKAGTGGGGIASVPAGIACGTDCSEVITTGTAVTLTATADATSTFAGWNGVGCAGTGTCSVTMDEAKSVTATFTRTVYPMTVTNLGGGTVNSTPTGIVCGGDCTEIFPGTTKVVLTAVPAPGLSFAGWAGACTNVSGTCTVTMTAATAVTATFRAPLTVTRAGNGSGKVTSTPPGIDCGSDCSEPYLYGTLVALTATANPDSVFTGWGGACSGTEACTVALDAAKNVTATFELVTATLTVDNAGGGTVTSTTVGINCGTTCSKKYVPGTVVILKALPAPTKSFTGWSGGGCSGTGNCTVTMDGPKIVSADFTVVPNPTLATFLPVGAAPGIPVTINGTNLGSLPGTVRFGAVQAGVTSWTSTAVKVTVPVGAITGGVVLTTDDGRETLPKQFTVPNPTVASLAPASGLIGTAVTLNGTNFGIVKGAVTFTAAAGGTVDATPTSWSDTSVKVVVPAGAGSGNVVLTRADQVSPATPKSFAVPDPKIISLAPASGLIGSAVTLNGSDFGLLQGSGGVTFTAAAGGPVPADVTSWSTTVVKVTVPAGATGGPVTLTRDDGVTASKSFAVPPPSIMSFTPATAAPGVPVTLMGSNFGLLQGSGGVTFTSGGGTAAATITSWSTVSVKLTVPVGATIGPVTLTRDDGVTVGKTFTVPNPTVTALAPASGLIGTAVTLNGSNLGKVAGTVDFTASAGGTVPATVTSWTDTVVKLSVPVGATSGNVVLTRADGVDAAPKLFAVPKPTITSLAPASAAPGVPVILNGTNFGATQGSGGRVTFTGSGGTLVAAVTSWTNASVKVTVPVGATVGPVTLTRDDGETVGKTFTVPNSVVSALAPARGAVGVPITLTGTGLGAVPGTVTFTGASGTVTAPLIGWTDTSVKVAVPAGAVDGPVILVRADAIAALPKPFVVPNPAIASLAPASGLFGSVVMINGTDLGTVVGSVTFTGDDAPLSAAIVTWTTTSVKVTVPVGARTGDLTLMTADGRTAAKLFTVPNPTLTSIAPTSAAPGVSVILSGTNLGGTPGTVTFQGSGGPLTASLAPKSVWSNASVTVLVPAGAQSGTVTLTRADGVSAGKSFTVPAPTIGSLTPVKGAVGSAVTVTGNHFGLIPGTVSFAGEGEAVPASLAAGMAWGNGSIKVLVPAGAQTGDLTVTTASGQIATRSFTVQ
jgi:uncharacterized repeat protein (TIGR02543 family)